ncbi:MAG TPA: serine hydrolase domain-containing protein [Acidimicrobiales bacterium]|nr:serine hydrolase domain-containing protein [Acidimicrobiales bacterium]
MDIGGDVAPGFEPVRDAFVANFARGAELGAAAAIFKDGVKIVDVWGGVADKDTGAPWNDDTLQLVFSTTKGATAACAALLMQRGLLDVDAPVAEYWPEFKAEGKDRIPVRWLLCHRAGLPALDEPLTPEQVCAWDPVVDALAAQKPWWEPGTKHGYHAFTYGHLVGEVVRRISGKSLGQFFAEEIANPIGAEFFIGLPQSEEHRVTKLVQGAPPAGNVAMTDDIKELVAGIMDPTSLISHTFNFAKPALDLDSPAVHAAEIPAANGICTARGLARFYASLIGEVDGVRVLDPSTVATVTTEQSNGKDEVLRKITRFALGFMLDGPDVPYFGSGSFGHDGAGGSLGFADPESGIAFGYVMNQMNQGINADPRPHAIIQALKGCLS